MLLICMFIRGLDLSSDGWTAAAALPGTVECAYMIKELVASLEGELLSLMFLNKSAIIA